jgi:hypothetical protein
MKIVFEQPVVNVVELATGPKGDAGPASTIPGPANTLTAGTVTQIPAGGQPTVSITGTAPSQTLNLGLVDGAPTAFELRGEGFPGTGSNATATNAAAVGTYYTDTLGTNGAWRWLKVSAGTGTARWTVVFGDTGWRNVTSLVTPESLGPANTGTLAVRRTEAGVALRFIDLLLAPGDGLLLLTVPTILTGFRPVTYFTTEISRSNTLVLANAVVMNSGQIIWLGERYTGAPSTTTNRPTVGIQGDTPLFSTADPWPSTLPGTPA